MRFNEFKSVLKEAKLGGKYWNVSSGSHDKYIPSLLAKIADSDQAISVHVKDKGIIPVKFTDNQKEKAVKLLKQQVRLRTSYDENIKDKIIGTTSDGEEIRFSPLNIDKSSVKISVNVGNITEGVLGFALAARFSKTGSPISEDDIMKVGKAFFANDRNEVNIKIADRTNDKLKCKVTLPRGDTKALQTLIEKEGNGLAVQEEFDLSTEAGKKLNTLISQAVSYANEGIAPKNALEKIISYYKDGITQTISVVSDGAEAENQSITKVDLSLEVDTETGKTETLSLLSLKAGTGRSQIGQTSGRTFDKLSLFWRQSFAYELPKQFKDNFNKTYEKNSDEEGKFILDEDSVYELLNGPILQTYKWAENKIEDHVRGNSEEKEVDFLRHLQKGLLYHSGKHTSKEDPRSKVRGNEAVVVTILNPAAGKSFLELRFGEKFYEIMKYFDLVTTGIQRQSGNTGLVLQVKVNPTTDINNAPKPIQEMARKLGKNAPLCQYRSYIQGTTIRNIIEIDKAAKFLASLENENILEPNNQKQQSNQDPKSNDANQTI
jgi:hypothetical protein